MSRTYVLLTGETPGAKVLVAPRGRCEYRDDLRPYYYCGEPFYERRYYRSRSLFPFGW